LPEFQQVKGISPSYPYVDAFIQRTQVAIQQGKDQTPLIDGTALVLVMAAAAVVVVGGAAAVVAFLLLRRSRPSGGPGQQPAAQGAPASLAGSAFSAGGWTAPAAPPPGPAPQPAPAAPTPGPTPAWTPVPQQPAVSPDGYGRWDGQRWVPNVPPAPQQAAPRDYHGPNLTGPPLPRRPAPALAARPLGAHLPAEAAAPSSSSRARAAAPR
jgi:hypothetical protein